MDTEIRQTAYGYPGGLLQYEGHLFGHPFYFRQKHGAWSINVVLPGRNPIRPDEGSFIVAHDEGNEEISPVDALLVIAALSRVAFDRRKRL